ncbi:sensor domain-containing diguanylate cyclase [Caballeronia sp. dw_276]|uniref:sensor domain-containing diguanylate cyclase n=1 Tax=Caballeronia sp. dw_276 TaxID=2719795 RepID=UPI001BD3E7EA|nr:sensor domain-containing diguanylate cyclase [Caballeronia sp. dw_276]
MRLATITNWAYAITVTLTVASGAAMLMATSTEKEERQLVAQRYLLDQATSRLDVAVLGATDLARQYVISGRPADLTAYRQELASLADMEERTRSIRDAGASADEIGALHDLISSTDRLRDAERLAFSAFASGQRNASIESLFSLDFERELDGLRKNVERFQDRLDHRTDAAVQQAVVASKLWRTIAELTLALTGLVFAFVLYFVFRRRVLHPVVKLSDVVSRLAAQDFAVEPPTYDRIDEIGDMAQALRVFRENGIVRQRLEHEREIDRAMRDSLSRMTERMHGCSNVQDLVRVVQRFGPEFVPQMGGRLYLLDDARDILTEACSWNGPVHTESEFIADECWGLRRGSLHRPVGAHIDIPCAHLNIDSHIPNSYCLPLMGQHGALGMLYLESEDDAKTEHVSDEYLRMLAENVGLALDNLRLRETLQQLAMADPLTKLQNRRQLDIWLGTQMEETERSGVPLSCAMIDIDFFKRFNDDHGHEAGDAVLRAVGGALKSSAVDSESVFRYGGEEFVVLMIGRDAQGAIDRAEKIRAVIAALVVEYDGHRLRNVTASIGVASAPSQCSRTALVQVADAALLRAKRKGRNMVETAAKLEER